MEKKTTWLIAAVIIIGVLVIGGFLFFKGSAPGQYDDFAKCLDEKDAKFYGAFWCPHCQNQKSLFKGSAKYLNYIECSTPDSQGKLSICTEANINAYPTWKFTDGTVQEGEMSLRALADKTGCSLPQ